jgi:ABC-type bacteriocin/lantibiotic exporter with double-glycine peptidase domain
VASTKEKRDIRILIDGAIRIPNVDFAKYSHTISGVIRASEPRFSVGIFGERGTGKTTLMSMIESLPKILI